MIKHPGDVSFTERKITDYFPMPGISLILASLIWIVFSFYFVAMLKDHCHRVKELRRLAAIPNRKPVKAEAVDKQISLRNSLRNPLLPPKEEKKEVKGSKENLSKEGINSPHEKLSAEKTDKTDKNANPSAETATTSKEVVKKEAEETGGDIKASAEMTKPDKASPSAEIISPSAEAINIETGSGGLKPSSELPKEPKSDNVALTFSEMMKKERKQSAERFNDTPEDRAKQAKAQKTWQQVGSKQKRSAEIIEENWRRENLGGKMPTAAKELSKEPAQPQKKAERCASSENIVVTASAENM